MPLKIWFVQFLPKLHRESTLSDRMAHRVEAVLEYGVWNAQLRLLCTVALRRQEEDRGIGIKREAVDYSSSKSITIRGIASTPAALIALTGIDCRSYFQAFLRLLGWGTAEVCTCFRYAWRAL